MDQQEEKQVQIQINQSLKNITWTESGIPTLTEQAFKPKTKTGLEKNDYPKDFILDFDRIVTQKNGHKLDCTCKRCLSMPNSRDVKALPSIKAEEDIQPFNKKRF